MNQKYSNKISKEKTVSSKLDNNLLFNIINLVDKDVFLEEYKIFINNHSNSEILSILTSKDDGKLFLKYLNNSITEIVISDLVSKLEKQFGKRDNRDNMDNMDNMDNIDNNSLENIESDDNPHGTKIIAAKIGPNAPPV